MKRENTLGVQISNLLEKQNMTQTDLSNKTGITQVSISRYINGTRTPKITTAMTIANALGVSIEELTSQETETCQPKENELQCAACHYTGDKKSFYNSCVHSKFKICPKCGTVRYVCDENRKYFKKPEN